MKTVLLVEESELNLAAMRNILEDTYKVVSAPRGDQALAYLESGECDIILLDTHLLEMDGFEVLERIRAMEQCRDVPVVFLTADGDSETEARCFQMGAADCIAKPLVPAVLQARIGRALELAELRRLHTNRTSHPHNKPHRDALTGLWDRKYFEETVNRLLAGGTPGTLLIVDIDNFKKINQNLGHIAGDQTLTFLAEILQDTFSPDDILCRLGDDDFAIFARGVIPKEDLGIRVVDVISRMHQMAKTYGLESNATISVGGAQAPEYGVTFDRLYSCADKALYYVKKSGKNAYHFFSEQMPDRSARGGKTVDLKYLQDLMNREDKGTGAYMVDFESFHHVYNFIHRFIDRSSRDVQTVLFTVSPVGSAELDAAETERALGILEKAVYTSLRRSDVSTRYSSRQLIVILMDSNAENSDRVAERIIENFQREFANDTVRIDYGIARMSNRKEESTREDWVVVVDGDDANRRMADQIFSEAKIHSKCFEAGQDMLDYLDGTRIPALILLDVHLPGLDGFEVLYRLRQKRAYRKVPVIFLTAEDDLETEKRGLDAGVVDFVTKPFVAEILLLRARNAISLYRLQNEMERELKLKTDKLSHVYLEVVKAMSLAIDAKDTYTNGHSTRVAEYARLIAQRAGYSDEVQEQIYIMGLLHDMGKIGIPDAIINKPGRLTEEEFEIIKRHSQIGAQILQSISEFPELSVGARWHHERYDGKGYPDGLVGQDIPETARLIAVADTYDAMTSNRSYRNILPQPAVKAEFERCRGTQFDPRFADIILQLIEEDKDYQLRAPS